MKKLTFAFIACLALFQSATDAAIPALNASLLEYEAITFAIGNNPDFQTIIDPNEFIVDIRKMRTKVDAETITYRITTRTRDDELVHIASAELRAENDAENHSNKYDRCKHHHHKHHHKYHPINLYIAELKVSVNPDSESNVVEVLEFKKVARQIRVPENKTLPQEVDSVESN